MQIKCDAFEALVCVKQTRLYAVFSSFFQTVTLPVIPISIIHLSEVENMQMGEQRRLDSLQFKMVMV